MTLPNFLILGAGKAGTTSLHYYLQQHPQIYMCPQKETCFFAYEGKTVRFEGPGDRELINRQAITRLDTYQQLFAGVTEETAIGEACPLYLYDASLAAERIHHYIPHAKLIAILRNPVDRAFSSYLMQVREGREPLDFAAAIAAEEARIQQNWSWGRYTQVGFYGKQLRHYFERFPASQIQIYLYEDLQQTPQKMLQDIFTFLDVDATFQPDMTLRHNISGLPQNSTLHHALSTLHAFLIGTSPLKQAVKRTLPTSWVQSFNDRYESLRARYFQKSLAKPTLPAPLRHQLIDIFREDILQLQTLIQRDLSHWLEKAPPLEPSISQTVTSA